VSTLHFATTIRSSECETTDGTSVSIKVRDPRGHNVSVAFLARVLGSEPSAASDAAQVAVLDPRSVELAFDHRKIVDDALNR